MSICNKIVVKAFKTEIVYVVLSKFSYLFMFGSYFNSLLFLYRITCMIFYILYQSRPYIYTPKKGNGRPSGIK